MTEILNTIKEIPEIGQKRRFNMLKRRLSQFFNDTKALGEYADNRNSKGKYVPVFITLTHENNQQWNPEDITNYTRKLSAFAKRNWKQVLRIVWVAETTKNGVIHYHILTWIPRNKRLPKPCEPITKTYKNGNTREYPAMWKHWAKIEGVRKGVFGYMLKYMSKGCIVGGLGIFKEVTRDNEYIVENNRDHYVAIKQALNSSSNLCLVRYRDNRMMLNKFNFKRYSFSNIIKRSDDNSCINKLCFNQKNQFKMVKFVTLIPIKQKVYPRLYGMSGMTKQQRQKMAYSALPNYVRLAFGDVKIGDCIRRIKGGFILKKDNIVDRVWKYWSYCEPTLSCNWSKFSYDSIDGNLYLGYHFGTNWSVFKQRFESNLFIPF